VEVWELGKRKVESERGGLVERVETEVGGCDGCEKRWKWRGYETIVGGVINSRVFKY
jgi:hypothetical protein